MKVRLLHVATLTAFALAQPLYDVLRRSGEFFVAHRVDRIDLLLLVAWVSLLAPLVAVVPILLASWLHRRAGDVATNVSIGVWAFVIAMPAIRRWTGTSTTEILVVSALLGLSMAIFYWQLPPVRSFVTLLSPAILIFPAFFLAAPSMRPFMAPAPGVDLGADVEGDTPIVFLIFDQLPLTSLLDPHGDIDAHAFPGFAALAHDAVWFRNASTVADYTGWAVPAILSGTFPAGDKLPIAQDYPGNLFTALAGRYRMEVVEPITHLCPDTVCTSRREPRGIRQRAMLADLSVVLARVILPPGLTSEMPRLTKGWRDFAAHDDWRHRWAAERDDDRREPAEEFIASIEAGDPQPTVYMLHALLPHEPYVYTRGGLRFARNEAETGITEAGQWPADPLFAMLAYRRHLLQTQYVDELVGRVIARLRDEDLYDRTLLVVTSDHGVSFRPGQPMKGFDGDTVADIVPVPLFIKPPHHTGPEVSDRNVQSVDILPTVAALLRTELRWRVDGVSALGSAPAAPGHKTLYYHSATSHRDLPPSLWTPVLQSAARKDALFGPSSEDDYWEPEALPFSSLLDRHVAQLRIGSRSAFSVQLDEAWQYATVNPANGVVPARFSGQLEGTARDEGVPIAVAVNGVVRATSRTEGRGASTPRRWTALARPDIFATGANTVDLYEIGGSERTPVLHALLHVGGRPDDLNLILGEAYYDWHVRDDGLYERERWDDRPFRWTNGRAQLSLAVTPGPKAPRFLRVRLAPLTRPGTHVEISVNGCALFAGTLPSASWDATFDLSRCPPDLFRRGDAVIHVNSDSARSGPDARALGVPVSAIQLSVERPARGAAHRAAAR
jgi:hypothetical protein